MRYNQDSTGLEIMIAEDDPKTRNDLTVRIEKKEASVCRTTSSAEEALEMLTKIRPDLVLMGFAFGGETGGTALAKTIETICEVPIVFITTREEEKQLEKDKPFFTLGSLTKPFQDEDIATVLDAARYVSRLNDYREKGERYPDIRSTYIERLRRMGYELAVSEERERRRIAIELHNNVGQCLSLLKMKMKQISGSDIQFSPEIYYKEILDLIDQIDTDTQYLISELSPPILYDLGLGTALKWLIDYITANHDLTITFEDKCAHHNLKNEDIIIIFRTIRELLENVIKHAKASLVRLCLHVENRYHVISIEDNGVGFITSKTDDPIKGDQNSKLFCIQERIYALGGRLDIVSHPDGGTKVSLLIPFVNDDEEP